MVLIRPQAYVFDLDGTLVDVSSIRHHVQGGSRDFDAFHTSAVNCPPVKWVKHMAIDRHMMGFKILLVTARSEKYRASTSWWIAENGVPSDELKMRGLETDAPTMK